MKRNIHTSIKNLSILSLEKFKKSILNKKKIIEQINKGKNKILNFHSKTDLNKISFK